MFDTLNEIQPWLPEFFWVVVLVIAALLSDLVIRRGLVAFVHGLASRTASQWDDVLRRQKVFSRVTHVIPALVIHGGVGAEISGITLPGSLIDVTQNVALAFMALTLTLAGSAVLAAANEVYEGKPIARERPLKGIVQVLQIVVYVIGAVFVLASLLDRSPVILLSGFGAMTAVLLVVFKDGSFEFRVG